jgi:serine/threonine protein kinase
LAEEEAERLNQFSSRNIVKFIESFKQTENEVEKLIIITEYCNLGDLSKVMKVTQGKPEYMPVFERIIMGTLQGLSALHNTKQLHRDIKPLNILICGDLNES